MHGVIDPSVTISPVDGLKRRALTWSSMAAENRPGPQA